MVGERCVMMVGILMTPMYYAVNWDTVGQMEHISPPTTGKVVVKYCLITFIVLVLNPTYGIVLITDGLFTTVDIMKMQVFHVTKRASYMLSS